MGSTKNLIISKKKVNIFLGITMMLFLFGSTLQIPAEESSTTYFVPDDYPTIQEAVNVAQADDQIVVRSGVYQENVFIDKALTLEGQGTPEINANGSYYCLELRSDNIVIDNFKLVNSGANGNKAAIRIISNDNIIKDCIVKNNENYGILIYKNVSGNSIQKTYLTKNYYGIYLQSTTDTIIENCTIYDNDIYGIHLRYADENTIQANTISDETVGLYLWEASDNMIMENFISNCSFHGIDLRHSNDNNIFNNFFNNAKNGFDMGENSWNREITQEINIIGGPYVCGNYWSDYGDSDTDANGIGDASFPIEGGTNQDMYPLFLQSNYAPYIPSNPSPSDASSKMKRKLSLSWQCSDPDEDACSYEIYLGTSNNNLQSMGTSDDCLFSLKGLHYDQKYYWQVIAYDNTTWNHSTQSPIWSFKTESKPEPSSSDDSSDVRRGYQNNPPVAEIDTNGIYQAYMNELILFDGSQSFDSDGVIDTYLWELGDETTAEGLLVNHAYKEIGEFTVTLTVKDNHGFSDTTSAHILIIKANRPPDQPTISGPATGVIGEEYTYQFTTIDKDNDTIKYIIDWGDNQTTESTFLPNATTHDGVHSWSTAGEYKITVKVTDNDTESSSTSISVLINAIYAQNMGYLIDVNNDGIYDQYRSNQTGATTFVEKKQDDVYLIDTDDDGEWEYEFVVTTQEVSAYLPPVSEQGKDNTMIMLSIGLLAVIIVIILVGILYKKKKNK